MPPAAAVPCAFSPAALPAGLLRLYRHARGGSALPAQPVTVLHLGADHTVVASGVDPKAPSIVLNLALGHDTTARGFFRGAVPTPLELETAIASVEDEVHAAHRQWKAYCDGSDQRDQSRPNSHQTQVLASGSAASPWSTDAGLHELATLAGIAPGPVRELPLDALERLFNRLASVSEGRPAAHEGLPESAAFAARLLVLRELMHHMPFAAITLATPVDSAPPPSAL